MIQVWKRDFEFNPDCITTIPLLVTLPNLLVGFWSNGSLSKITSALSKPRYFDKITMTMEHISYAHGLVEVDVSQPLIEFVVIASPDGIYAQRIDYEWRS